MKTEMEAYLEAYTDVNLDYSAIQTAILNSVEWMGFLTVIAGNQVVLVHSLGLYSVAAWDVQQRRTTRSMD
jgi:hypothetical protein